LVAGSSPAGATKFSDENHAVKPPFKVAFLFLGSTIGSRMAAGFSHPFHPSPLHIIQDEPHNDFL
jgi:hypothetical protein